MVKRNHLLLDVTMAEEITGWAGGPNLETSESAREATEQTGLHQGQSVPVPSRDLPEADRLSSAAIQRSYQRLAPASVAVIDSSVRLTDDDDD